MTSIAIYNMYYGAAKLTLNSTWLLGAFLNGNYIVDIVRPTENESLSSVK